MLVRRFWSYDLFNGTADNTIEVSKFINSYTISFQGPTNDVVISKLREAFQLLTAGYKTFTFEEKKKVSSNPCYQYLLSLLSRTLDMFMWSC